MMRKDYAMTMKKTSSHFLGRREVIRLGATGVVALAGLGKRKGAAFAQSSIVVTPSLTEGPYFVDEMLNRSDIRVDPTDTSVQEGFPMLLRIVVSQIDNDTISPLTGASVDVWHCNALGIYSDVQAQGTTGKKFLRGYQVTNRHGEVRFRTIYPGWYSGRTVHIHVKVRLFVGSLESYEFTTQFFFDDAITDEVYALSPYNQRGSRDTLNSTDGIFLGASTDGAVQSNSGSLLLLRVATGGGFQHGVASFRIARDDL
jgi:protocatechuate 3,4-dioxygenase beta subunit